jgi:hypothetical protein
VIFIEVKATNGKLSKLQEYRLKELQNHGVKVEVFREEKIKSNEKSKGLVQSKRGHGTD